MSDRLDHERLLDEAKGLVGAVSTETKRDPAERWKDATRLHAIHDELRALLRGGADAPRADAPFGWREAAEWVLLAGWRAVQRGTIDSRSALGDALLALRDTIKPEGAGPDWLPEDNGRCGALGGVSPRAQTTPDHQETIDHLLASARAQGAIRIDEREAITGEEPIIWRALHLAVDAICAGSPSPEAPSRYQLADNELPMTVEFATMAADNLERMAQTLRQTVVNFRAVSSPTSTTQEKS